MSKSPPRRRAHPERDRCVRILVSDRDPAVRGMVRYILEKYSVTWQVETATDGRETLDAVCDGSFDVAFLNAAPPNLNGTEIFRSARRRHIPTDVVILTENDNLKLAVRAVKEGVQDVLGKPIDADDLISVVLDSIGRRHLPPRTLARRLDAYLKDHVSDPSLSRADLCRHFRISPGYVSRLFRGFYRTTYQRRRTFFRVEKAKKLMKSGRLPLYAVAAKCGFRTQSRLTEAFRMQEGIPPKTYQKAMASNDRNG